MASPSEIKSAIKILRESGCPNIAILHCVSSYPAQPKQMNLSTISDISKRFNVIAGLSDHTLSTTTAIASIPLGAKIIEKHLTINRKDGGPDSEFSLEPNEFGDMIKAIREVELAIGKPTYSMSKDEGRNVVFRKSLFAVKNIEKGETFTNDNLRSIRPGFGLPPSYLNMVLGKVANKKIDRGTPITKKLIK